MPIHFIVHINLHGLPLFKQTKRHSAFSTLRLGLPINEYLKIYIQIIYACERMGQRMREDTTYIVQTWMVTRFTVLCEPVQLFLDEKRTKTHERLSVKSVN